MKKLITTTILSLLITAGAFAQNCAASFTFSGTSANPYLVQFVNTSTHSNLPGTWVSYSWDFGDGNTFNTSTTMLINHSYNNGGMYGVCLTISVQDSNGVLCNDMYCDTIVVNSSGGLGCAASFTSTSSAGNTVDFTNTSTQSGGSNYVNYSWNFGDGSFATGLNPTHTYSASGQYAVCLTMFSMDTLTGDSCLSSFCDSVYAMGSSNPTFCTASYWVDTTTSSAAAINVYNNSTPLTSASYVTTYLWDFGDGSSSTQQFPTHSYASSGLYNLCLTIISVDQNLDTCTDTYCHTLGVDSLGQVTFKTNGPGFTLNILDPASIGLNETVLNDVSIYPNPSAGAITLDLGTQLVGETTWSLYDLKGVNIANGNASDIQTTIDVSGLSNGIYLLTIENGAAVSNQKLQILK
jgi:PKD repeat protein